MGSSSLPYAMFALTAAAMAWGISAAFGLVWRALRPGWAGFLCLGFAFQGLGHLVNYLHIELSFVDAARYVGPFVACAYACFTRAIIEYTDFAPDRRPFWTALAVGYALFVVALIETRSVGFGGLMVLQAAFPVVWALLFVRAYRLEPRPPHLRDRGRGIVEVAAVRLDGVA